MKRVARAGSPAAGDSSPCSAESSFRELDDAFLQDQTRIWLGEVLRIRFDEETAVSDLLADGELLFQVSKIVWKMLLKKHGELKNSTAYMYERTSSGNSNGRYMPYPKVDSFLKICQILGLTGIDLFSPSDVVEKKDVRRVCMCIRSFSKKARSKNLKVPDFDIVTYTIAMPTDMVGGIRRYLEQSQFSPSSSNGCSSPSIDPWELYRQKSPGGPNTLQYDSYSESDDAESAFTELEFQSPLTNSSYETTNFSNIIGQDSPKGNSVVDVNLCELQSQFRLDIQEQVEVVDKRCIQNDSHERSVELSNIREVISPLASSRNIVDIKHIDSNYHQNVASLYEHLPRNLYEPHNVDEAFIQCGPPPWIKGLENTLPKSSSSKSDINLDHPKQEFVTSLVSSTVSQTIDYSTEYMEISNKNSMLKSQGVMDEKTTVGIEQKDMENGLKKVFDQVEAAQENCSIPSEDQYSSNDCTKEVNLCAFVIDKPANNHVKALCKVASDIYKENSMFIDEKYCSNLEDSPDLLDKQCKDKCFNSDPKSDCNSDESNFCFDKGGYTLEEGNRSDLKMDSDEQVNNSVMLMTDENITDTGLSAEESQIPQGIAMNVSEHQITDKPSSGHSEGAVKMEVAQEKDAYDNGRRKKESEECERELIPELSSNGGKCNKILKSVAGTMTLLGVLFLFSYVRQKREKEKNTESTASQQNHKPSEKFPMQKRVDIVKPDQLPAKKIYPGERLKF